MGKVWGPFHIMGDSLMLPPTTDGRPAPAATAADIAKYEGSVLGMLRSFEAIQAGRALLAGLRASHQKIPVLPYDMPDVYKCQAEEDTNDFFGTRVFFTPNAWFATSECYQEGGAGNSAHEVLFHEMVHAFRSATGVMQKVMTLDEEERIAVAVTNIFASETHRPLRKDHDSFAINTDPKTNNSAGFLHANSRLLYLFIKDHKQVSDDLAKIDTPFNPIREYYKVHRKKI